MSEHMTPDGAQEATGGRESASRPGNEARDIQVATDAPDGRTAARHPQPRPKGCDMTDQPTPAPRGPIDYAREHAAAAEDRQRADRYQDRIDRYQAVLLECERRILQAQAAIARAHHVADLIAAGAPWTASRADTARRIREALNPQEQRTCRRCDCPAGIPDCTHCNCCDVPDPQEQP